MNTSIKLAVKVLDLSHNFLKNNAGISSQVQIMCNPCYFCRNHNHNVFWENPGLNVLEGLAIQ